LDERKFFANFDSPNEGFLMARIKNIEAFCTVCGNVTKMELGGDIPVFGNVNKRWAKCKKCRQKVVVDYNSAPTEKEIDLEVDSENFSEYSPQRTYVLGESIYHKGWDDYGKVIGKVRNSITVEFQKIGQKKLIESVTS